LPLADVAQTLKLGTRQVAALEGDDWSVLPGATFVRGFVRNYSRLLDVDPAPLMRQLDAALEKPKDTLGVPEVSPKEVVVTSRSKDRAVIALGGLLLLLAALAYFLIPGDLQSWRSSMQAWVDDFSQTPVAQVEPARAQEPLFPPGATTEQLIAPPATAVKEGADLAVPAAVNLPVTPEMAPVVLPPVVEPVASPVGHSAALRLQASKESWIEVRDSDKNVILSRRLAAGAAETLNGKAPFSVVIGYAAGVSVTWRGQAIDLAPYSKNNVARLVLE
jgi:cytoskeleton protein RodZ